MKKLVAIILSVFFLNNLSYSEEKCSDLDGSKKLSKNSIEYAKCIGNKAKDGSGLGRLARICAMLTPEW